MYSNKLTIKTFAAPPDIDFISFFLRQGMGSAFRSISKKLLTTWRKLALSFSLLTARSFILTNFHVVAEIEFFSLHIEQICWISHSAVASSASIFSCVCHTVVAALLYFCKNDKIAHVWKFCAFIFVDIAHIFCVCILSLKVNKNSTFVKLYHQQRQVE